MDNSQGVKTLENGSHIKTSTLGREHEQKSKLMFYVEVSVVFVIIVVMWGLVSLPIIFYHLPLPQVSSNTTTSMNNSINGECLSSRPYPTTNGVCQTPLTGVLLSMNCAVPDHEGNILVLQNGESTAVQVISGLDFLQPSDVCRTAVVPFLCLYLFGLCDESGVFIQPTLGECEEIRDVLCQEEWETAVLFNIPLPDCTIFPRETASCSAQNGSDSGSGIPGEENILNFTNSSDQATTTAEVETLECREDFFREKNSSSCVPSCFSWMQYPTGVSISIDVVVFITAFIGFFAALAVIIISLLRYKRMFVFPSVFVVYEVTDLLVLAFFVMVGYMDRSTLFCSSKNLLESLQRVTPFCVISGMLFSYILFQSILWWIFHTATLFWKIRFPLHSRSFEGARKIKYIHVTCVIVGILLPLVTVVASMADFAAKISDKNTTSTFLSGGLGYGMTRFPPILCTGTGREAIFYSLALPIDIILGIGCTFLIIMIWTIHTKQGLFKVNKSKNPLKIGTAEKKLLIIFFYYVLLATIALTSFTVSLRDSGLFADDLEQYFFCELRGHDPNKPCRKSFSDQSGATLTSVSYILLGLYPLVNLVFALNINELKVICCGDKEKTKRLLSLSTTSTTCKPV